MTVSEKRKRWDDFVAAFNGLGVDNLGMSPAAAYLLAIAAVEYCSDQTKEVRALTVGAPVLALDEKYGGPIVHIPGDYGDAREFWDVHENEQNAQVTQKACDYVQSKINVFKLLNGL